jgi:peptide deformylase
MIITNNEEALRMPCQDVLPDEVGHLINILENELSNANRLGKGGIGLAAPQIGIYKKAAIVRLDSNHGLSVNLINSKIEKGYDPSLFHNEGCLSFPGRVEDTTRFQETYVVNNLIYPHSFIATGLFSIVIQHEIDHYNGVLFIDHKVVSKPHVYKVGPNDPCPCGKIDVISGRVKKYKKCCWR